MTATVRLDKSLEEKLEWIALTLHQKKSDIIRDAISFYAQNVENEKKIRLQKAIAKTKNSDYAEMREWDGAVNDGL